MNQVQRMIKKVYILNLKKKGEFERMKRLFLKAREGTRKKRKRITKRLPASEEMEGAKGALNSEREMPSSNQVLPVPIGRANTKYVGRMGLKDSGHLETEERISKELEKKTIS